MERQKPSAFWHDIGVAMSFVLPSLSSVAIGVGLLLPAADEVPTYNLSPSCRSETMSAASDRSCLGDEQHARDKLLGKGLLLIERERKKGNCAQTTRVVVPICPRRQGQLPAGGGHSRGTKLCGIAHVPSDGGGCEEVARPLRSARGIRQRPVLKRIPLRWNRMRTR
jgi:hypothetical protein